jgi:hypothetical protein
MRVHQGLIEAMSFAIIACAAPNAIAYDPDSFTVFYPSRDFTDIGEAVSQAQENGFHGYSAVVKRAARKDRKALSRLFYIDAHASWDAAGAELQNSVMRQMLLLWGDYDFALVLGHQPREIQKHVCSNFRMEPYDKSFSVLFPHTAEIMNRVWSKQ